MAWGRRVFSSVLLAAAILAAFSARHGSAGELDDPNVMLFSGRDIWRNGGFAYGGLLIAPGGFDDDGLMLKLVLTVGVYRYNSANLGGLDVEGVEWVTQAMPGWRIKRGDLETKFFFGLDTQLHHLYPDDPGNRLRGRKYGLRMATEFWYEPAPSAMIAGDASLSSVGGDYAARLAFGWKILDGLLADGFYIGPEAQYYGADDYGQTRFGAHITSMKTETTEWLAAGGWARGSDGTSSLYLRLGLSRKE
jgi:hypothetical protein